MADGGTTFREAMRRAKRAYIEQALDAANGDTRIAACNLGMAMSSLYSVLARTGGFPTKWKRQKVAKPVVERKPRLLTQVPVAPAREHSVMVVRACGREWVLRPWRPK